MKNQFEINFWYLSAFCFILSGVLIQNVAFIVLGFAYIVLAFSKQTKK